MLLTLGTVDQVKMVSTTIVYQHGPCIANPPLLLAGSDLYSRAYYDGADIHRPTTYVRGID